MSREKYDIAIVGAGILGLAHAWAACRLGKSVVVIDRQARAIGASIRNFGFVTVSGQQQGDCWAHARRSRDIWSEIAGPAGISVLQKGLVVTARCPEGEAVLDAFQRTDMGADCALLTPEQALDIAPALRRDGMKAALWSPHELRVESREAIPALASWLAQTHEVAFHWQTEVLGIAPPQVETSRGVIEAEAVIVCPGDDLTGLYADRIAAAQVTRCKLQMLRVMPDRPAQLPCAVMSDLSLARYHGFADLPEAAALKTRMDREKADHRAAGIHLIAVRSADGSLVVGDSHVYGPSPDPFQDEAIDQLILDELAEVLETGPITTCQRWTGTYASADQWLLRDTPDPAVRLVVVTAGCGASTAFSIGEQTLDEIYTTETHND